MRNFTRRASGGPRPLSSRQLAGAAVVAAIGRIQSAEHVRRDGRLGDRELGGTIRGR